MRALSMRHTVVPSGDREAFRRHASELRARCAGAGCRYWMYEDENAPGAYVEFFEAPDRESLVRAQHVSGEPQSPVYLEVELT